MPRLPQRRLGLLLVVAALLSALLLPALFDGLSMRGQRAILVTLTTVVLWTRSTLDAGTTAMLAITLLALTGAAPTVASALQGFVNPVPYFLIGVLAMGLAVARSGLAERIARRILAHARGRGLRVFVHLVLAMPVLTFVLPSATTRSGILVHIYEEVFALARVPARAGVVKAVMLALCSINRLASTALLTGGITPMMSAGIIGGLSWTGWFALMAVPYYAILLLGAGLTWVLYHRGLGAPMPASASGGPAAWTAHEGRTLAIVLGASVLWLTDGIHHLDPAVPALVALVALLSPGIRPLAWSDLDRGVGWANFFVIGASVSLAHALAGSGAAAWLAERFVGGLGAWSRQPLVVVVLLMLGATALRAFIPNIAGFLALGLPVAMSVGREAGMDPVLCALVVMVTGDAVLYYPAQSASSLVVWERGHVTAGDVLKFGLWMTLVAYATILFVALPYWTLIGRSLTRP
jgi:solute carrier family 13 (sodium-dependent dicarboxylate transporter), member 2/3/5